MTSPETTSNRNGLEFSRRGFLEASSAVAGVMSVGRWLTTQATAADPAIKPGHPLDPLTTAEIEPWSAGLYGTEAL
jgi:hypothetical protein